MKNAGINGGFRAVMGPRPGILADGSPRQVSRRSRRAVIRRSKRSLLIGAMQMSTLMGAAACRSLPVRFPPRIKVSRMPFASLRHFGICLGLSLCALHGALVTAAESETGEQIYRRLCVDCHGAKGEGTEEYRTPLLGDRSIPDLARLIAKTMPKDEAEQCVGEDADKVAAYIYDAFYSPAAQARNNPPRVELSRLTVRQYRHTVSDLVGSFRNEGNWNAELGLKAEYYKEKRFRREDRIIERIDPQVNFDFGLSNPAPEKYDGNDFSIRWEGSVQAPETGIYDFVVRTEHATRLWINDNQRPLIDAWVKSGNDTEYRESIFLLGGRVYPLKLEFSKAKQGVDDKKQAKPTQASIALLWKLPHRAVEVIPARYLRSQRFPETFVVQTPFPPDDRSVGYERGTSVSKAWDTATTDAALETADFIVKRLNELAGTRDDAEDRQAKAREFCQRFAERAFRRPLSDEQRELFINQQFDKAPDVESAVKRVVLLVLKSPRFLYQTIDTDQYAVAERLAWALWDSLPDQNLRDAAKSGQLQSREQVVQQAERLAAHPRAQAKLRDFFVQWLRLDHMTEISKDPQGYPEFNVELATDLRNSLDMFVEEVIASEASDFRELLLADSLYLNGRLAKFYGADLPPDAPFTKVALEAGERAGVLSHPYLLAGFAYTATSSPIHRGVFVARSVLGRSLRPPPEAVSPLAPDLHADLTTRERVALQTSAESCMSCHEMINPLGFALEKFDAVGRLRKEEKSKPVDATGHYETRSGERTNFNGVRELATFLAASEETHEAFVAQLFHYLVKQPIGAYGQDQLPELRRHFAENHFKMRRLMVDIGVTAALETPPPPGGP